MKITSTCPGPLVNLTVQTPNPLKPAPHCSCCSSPAANWAVCSVIAGPQWVQGGGPPLCSVLQAPVGAGWRSLHFVFCYCRAPVGAGWRSLHFVFCIVGSSGCRVEEPTLCVLYCRVPVGAGWRSLHFVLCDCRAPVGAGWRSWRVWRSFWTLTPSPRRAVSVNTP